MSDSEEAKADATDRQALARLESSVTRMLEETAQLRDRSRKAEARIEELEALLRRFTKGDDDPARLQTRLSMLASENHELKGRIREGRDGVERLLSRIRFLEDQR